MRMRFRKFLAVLLVVDLVFSNAILLSAEQSVSRVPVRSFFEEQGGTVSWDDESRSITATRGEDTYLLFADNKGAQRNGTSITLQDGIVIEDGRSLISEADLQTLLLGEVGYLGATIGVVSAMADQIMTQFSVPGMTIAIVDAEEGFTWTEGFGYADTGVAVDEFTLFGMGSISKSFTAVAVMQLVEKGLIDLDEPIVTYLPMLRMPSDLSGKGDYRKITPRMLLAHAAGLAGDWIPGMMWTGGYHPEYINDFLGQISNLSMQSPEAANFSYANNGYTLLGILVAKMAGYSDFYEGYVSYMRENVLRRAGMELSTFALEGEHLPFLAKQYRDADDQDEFVYLNPLAAGGLYANASDMARFMHTILGGGIYDEQRLLSEGAVAQMFEPQSFGIEPDQLVNMRFGLGFYQTLGMDGFNHRGHDGDTIHYHSSMAFDLDNDLGVLVSVNSITGAAVAKPLAAQLLRLLVAEKTGGVPLPESAAIEPVSLAKEELDAYTGYYVVISAEDLIVISAEDGFLSLENLLPVPLALQPLSDGSFINPETGLRFWLEEFDDGMIMYLGEFKSQLVGEKVDPAAIAAPAGFEKWVGTYDVVLREQEVNTFYRIEVGTDENGFAYIKIPMYFGQTSYSPLASVGGDDFAGGISFVMDDGGSAWLELAGMRAKRTEG